MLTFVGAKSSTIFILELKPSTRSSAKLKMSAGRLEIDSKNRERKRKSNIGYHSLVKAKSFGHNEIQCVSLAGGVSCLVWSLPYS